MISMVKFPAFSGHTKAVSEQKNDKRNSPEKSVKITEKTLICSLAAISAASAIYTAHRIKPVLKQLENQKKAIDKIQSEIKTISTDFLTGLNNRQQMEVRLKEAISLAERSREKNGNSNLTCILLDVDFFKKINDTCGHQAGDEVLRKLAQVIKSSLREHDVACRYGGEEFFVILPETSSEEAEAVAQRLLKTIRDTKIDISKYSNTEKEVNVTVSIGVKSLVKGESAENICHGADVALYEAKRTGRDKVVVFSPDIEKNGKSESPK